MYIYNYKQKLEHRENRNHIQFDNSIGLTVRKFNSINFLTKEIVQDDQILLQTKNQLQNLNYG